MKPIKKFQIGKNGLTDSFIEQMKGVFKNEEMVKISVLSSCTRNKDEAKKIGDDLLDALGKNFTCRLIGYTLVVRKWRRAIRSRQK